jgi:hypothetical protein
MAVPCSGVGEFHSSHYVRNIDPCLSWANPTTLVIHGSCAKGILADQPKSKKHALTAKDLLLSRRSPF